MDKKDRKEMKNMGGKNLEIKKMVATNIQPILLNWVFVLCNVFSWADGLIQGQLRPV